MTELSRLISRLQKAIRRHAPYVKSIRYPKLLISSLKELNGLIGNEKVKDSVATQVSHLIAIQRRALKNPTLKPDQVMLNTVLYGSPGTGKTLIGTKLARVWYSLGYLRGSHKETEPEESAKERIDEVLETFFEGGKAAQFRETNEMLHQLSDVVGYMAILMIFVSIAYSFYDKFGGYLTFAIIAIILYIAFAVDSEVKSVVSRRDEDKARSTEEPFLLEEKSTEEETVPSDEEIITVVSRADFVDKYVGWSDKKTLKLLRKNVGKVLFVDEAYSLMTGNRDTFGMEVLTTLNLFLSEHPTDIIVIFAGYKDLMEQGIFSAQPGLCRRFMWHFECSGYTSSQLFRIFKMQLAQKGWGLTDPAATRALFRKHKDAFENYGGDTERLTFFAELEHSRDLVDHERELPSMNLGMVDLPSVNLNLLRPRHVRKGIAKLRENNIQKSSKVKALLPELYSTFVGN